MTLRAGIYFLQFQRLEVWDQDWNQDAGMVSFWRDPSSWSADCCPLAVSSWDRVGERVREISAISSFKGPNPINKLWKILKEMGILDHLTCLLRNLYTGQEATVRTGHGTTDWFQIGKGVRQACILSPCAGVQPRLIQGIRRRDSLGDLFKC